MKFNNFVGGMSFLTHFLSLYLENMCTTMFGGMFGLFSWLMNDSSSRMCNEGSLDFLHRDIFISVETPGAMSLECNGRNV